MLSLWMGTAIVGRYVLIGPVGYGGVSVVYQAIDTHRGSRTAIKLLAPDFADDEYRRMLCLETANALDDAVTVHPIGVRHLETTIAATPIF